MSENENKVKPEADPAIAAENAGKAAAKEKSPRKAAAKKKFIVEKAFRDIAEFSKIFREGDDVSHLNKDRLAHLIRIGYVVEK